MKVFKLGETFEHFFSTFASDGTLTAFNPDGFRIRRFYDSAALELSSGDAILNYPVDGRHMFEFLIDETIEVASPEQSEGVTEPFFIRSGYYEIIPIGTATIDGTSVVNQQICEFAIAPYGAVNITDIDGTAIESGTPDVNVTTVGSSPVVDMWATVSDLPSEPLDAAGIRTAVGMASANLDTILAEIDTDVQAILQIEQGKAVIADEGGTLVLRIYDKDNPATCVAAWELKDIDGNDVTMTDPFARRNPIELS